MRISTCFDPRRSASTSDVCDGAAKDSKGRVADGSPSVVEVDSFIMVMIQGAMGVSKKDMMNASSVVVADVLHVGQQSFGDQFFRVYGGRGDAMQVGFDREFVESVLHLSA